MGRVPAVNMLFSDFGESHSTVFGLGRSCHLGLVNVCAVGISDRSPRDVVTCSGQGLCHQKGCQASPDTDACGLARMGVFEQCHGAGEAHSNAFNVAARVPVSHCAVVHGR